MKSFVRKLNAKHGGELDIEDEEEKKEAADDSTISISIGNRHATLQPNT